MSDAPPKPLSRGWHRGGVAFVGLLLGLFLGELAMRAFYTFGQRHELEFTHYSAVLKRAGPSPELPFEHVPNSQTRLMGVIVRTNDHGQRGGPVSERKLTSTFRLACLGDSLTFGWGVPEEETYCAQVARRLRAAPFQTGVDRIEAINFGVGNYNTAIEVEVFRRKVLRFSPDFVVLQYYINDAEPTPAFHPSSFIERSYLALFLWARTDLLLRQIGARQDYVAYYQSLYRHENPGLAAFRASISALARESRQNRIHLGVVIFPELHKLDESEPFQAIYREVEDLWRSERVPVVNLWPRFAGKEPQTFWVDPGDVHPNAAAQSVAAEAIEQLIREGRAK